jgi:hypothetical protein
MLRLQKSLLAWCVLAALSVTARAGLYIEAGDAGNLPGTAQYIYSVIGGGDDLLEIQGNLLPGNDSDMFVFRLEDPAIFGAFTEATANNGDTQLFLFHLDGRGIAHNDDDAENQPALTSRITTGGPLTIGLAPGLYMAGISWFNNDPFWNAPPVVEGDYMFPFNQQPGGPLLTAPPTPGGAINPVTGWDSFGDPPFAGSYSIFLKNASVVPEPAMIAIPALAALLGARRRR